MDSDTLLSRLRRLTRDEISDDKPNGQSVFWYQVGRAVVYLWEKSKPGLRWLNRFFGWFFRWYVRQWQKVVYRKVGDVKVFSTPRASAMVVFTLWYALFGFYPTVLFVWEAFWYTVSSETETIYTNGSQEIDPPDGDVWSIKGCESLPCSDQNAIYYRVKATLFHHVYSLVTRGQFFLPDYVAAPVPSTLTRCRIHHYFFRVKFLMRNLNIYPLALSITCEKSL